MKKFTFTIHAPYINNIGLIIIIIIIIVISSRRRRRRRRIE